jgi:F-type H+-transporting ATPase subunit beta
VTTIAAHIDSMIVLSRQMAAEGMYPPIDPIASSSILLDPLVVGEEHAAVATKVRRNIEHYRELQDVISLLGIEELGAEDRRIVEHARRLQRFFTQPFADRSFLRGARPLRRGCRHDCRLQGHPRRRM